MSKPQITDQQKLRAGEYQLHVLLEATSGVCLQRESDVDCLLSFSAFGETSYSKVKKNVGYQETYWGEHFYFNQHFDSEIVAEGQRLVISVWDHNKIMKNSLVGSFEIDVGRIYSEKDHTMHHVWFALANAERDFNEITGYVKLSMNVCGEKDQPQEIKVQLQTSSSEKKVIMSPNIERKIYQLQVDIACGRCIIPVDNGTADPFVSIQFGTIVESTQRVDSSVNPEFWTKVCLPLALPAITQGITVRLSDYNKIFSSTVLGSHKISVNKLVSEAEADAKINNRISNLIGEKKVKGGFEECQWLNLYGSQISTKYPEPALQQQNFPQLAPFYAGSLLMRFKLTQNVSPIRKIEPIKQKQRLLPLVFYKFQMRILAGVNLPSEYKNYCVSLRIGNQEVMTDAAECVNGFCSWTVKKTLTIGVHANQPLPDTFVYLVDGSRDKRICYLRYPSGGWDIQKEAWKQLRPDKAQTLIKTEEAGYLRLQLGVEKATSFQEPQSFGIPSRLSLATKNNRSGKVIIELICAEGIYPQDMDGYSDPYFIFRFLNGKATTRVIENSLNPIYFEKLIIEGDVYENGLPPIIVECQDQDVTTSDFIGSCAIDLDEGLSNGAVSWELAKPAKPTWYELRNNNKVTGKFLAAFTLLKQYRGSIPKVIDLPRRQYVIYLLMIGLRNVKSTGFLSVKRPYIQFDYDSLNRFTEQCMMIDNKVKGKQAAFSRAANVTTEPLEYGQSVNINCVNMTRLVLPSDPNYWPFLCGRVKDYVLGGYYEPQLGHFSISLRDAFLRSQSVLNDLTSTMKNQIKNEQKLQFPSRKLAKVSQITKQSLLNYIVQCLNYDWPILTNKLDLNKIGEPIKSNRVVILPAYSVNKDETITEDHRAYIENNRGYIRVGYDTPETRRQGKAKNRHYRFCLPGTYESYFEQTTKSKVGIFDDIPIITHRQANKDDNLAYKSMMNLLQDENPFGGIYKGNCIITPLDQNHGELESTLKNVLQKLMVDRDYFLYLYILSAKDLPSKDTFSQSDSYIVVRSGDQVVNLSQRAMQDMSNPTFNEKVKMRIKFPKNSLLSIEVWDQDVVKDEMIGTVQIDLENRVLAALSKGITNNPIEVHSIRARQSAISQGTIKLWLDLVESENVALYRELDISSPPIEEYEVRVIIWSCQEIPAADAEDGSDIYVICNFSNQTATTDTHFRSFDGVGNFNWRCVFPSVKLPLEDTYLTLKVYDKDIFSPDDYIVSTLYNIRQDLEMVQENARSLKLYKGTIDPNTYSNVPSQSGKIDPVTGVKMYDRFRVPLTRRHSKQGQEGHQQSGSVQISVQILTKTDAIARPAGSGRSEPNQYPNLPDPTGRLQFSFNPCTMVKRLLGPTMTKYFWMLVATFFLIAFLYNVGYSFFGSWLANKLS